MISKKYIICSNKNKSLDSCENIFVDKNNRYVGYSLNEHHWKTEYVFNVFLPKILKDLNIDFNKDDFIKINNFNENNKHDLSFLMPKYDKVVIFRDFQRNIKKSLNISELVVGHDEHFESPLGEMTYYHRLYRGAHSCSEIINNDSATQKTLILNGDSMAIPLIPILSYYYKRILYIDNRKTIDIKNVIQEYINLKSDYVILMIDDGSQERRIKRNMCGVCYDDKKKIIVSMTSWKKRIQYVSRTIVMMECQTLVPDLIVLNLSTDEFPKKEKELPEEIMLLLSCFKNLEIFWVKENTKAFKKVIPTIERFKNEDCWILSVDDDWLYRKDYVEYMVKKAEFNRNCYITPGTWGMWPHGYAMIYNTKWFKNDALWRITKPDTEKIVSSDLWIMRNLELNKIKCVRDKNIEKLIKDLNMNDKLSKQYTSISFEERNRNVYKILNRITKK